jgi:hypothetical protein
MQYYLFTTVLQSHLNDQLESLQILLYKLQNKTFADLYLLGPRKKKGRKRTLDYFQIKFITNIALTEMFAHVKDCLDWIKDHEDEAVINPINTINSAFETYAIGKEKQNQ